MNKKQEKLEILCDCGAINQIPFKASFQEYKIKCSKCGVLIYWHHCLECNTGYSDGHRIGRCPECSPNNIKKLAVSNRWKIIKKQCPWCDYPVLILSGSNYIRKCPSCNKYYEITGYIIFIFVFMLSIGIIAYFFNRYLFVVLFDLFPIRIVSIIFGIAATSISFLLSIRFLSIRKWKEK